MKLVEAMKAKTAVDLDRYIGDPAWVAEEKYDGTRYLSYIRGGEVRIISRRGVTKTDRFPQLHSQLLELARLDPRVEKGAIFDGEIIAAGGFLQTMSLVGSLGSRGIHQTVDYKYRVFDVLMIDGKMIWHNPLIKRRRLLERLLGSETSSPYFANIEITEQQPMSYEFLDKIWGAGGEGVMIKNLHAPYEPGKRSRWWLKVKAVETADGVIMGMNSGEGKYHNTLGSLMIGQHHTDHGQLILKHVTNISGMTDELRNEFWFNKGKYLDIFKPTVVEFAYQLKTKDSYRHPRFKRFRPDKDPKECIWNG